jgi:hypothetical protein
MVGGWVKLYGGCWVCGHCVCLGVSVRDCRGLGLCTVGTVGQSVGGECIGWKGSVVTVWGG